jgi:hypothetical protein
VNERVSTARRARLTPVVPWPAAGSLDAHIRAEQVRLVFHQAPAAQALGLIGDRSAVDPLLDIVKTTTNVDLQRAFAAVALGIIGEKEDLPWNYVFSVNSNYRAKVPALSEILDIL